MYPSPSNLSAAIAESINFFATSSYRIENHQIIASSAVRHQDEYMAIRVQETERGPGRRGEKGVNTLFYKNHESGIYPSVRVIVGICGYLPDREPLTVTHFFKSGPMCFLIPQIGPILAIELVRIAHKLACCLRCALPQGHTHEHTLRKRWS